MAEITYGGWSMFDKVTIVEKTRGYYQDENGYWKVGIADLPQGYVVDTSNKKMLNAALSWAKWEEYPKTPDGRSDWEHPTIHEGICHEVDNSGFILQLLDSAEDSSQGGKLSFWNCKITHGERSWKIGIAADLLLDVLKNTTFINGVCQEPLFFARKNGKVGMLCKSMEAYKQAQQDQVRKSTMSKGKTKKYVEGQTYETLTMKDVYLGYFWQHYDWREEYHYGWWNGNTRIREITKLEKPVKVFWLPNYHEDHTKRSDYKLQGWNLQETCPARRPGKESVELDGSLKEFIDARHEYLTSVERGEGYTCYLDRTWFINTDPDNWEWPKGMKELLIKGGWTINE